MQGQLDLTRKHPNISKYLNDNFGLFPEEILFVSLIMCHKYKGCAGLKKVNIDNIVFSSDPVVNY